MNIRFLLLFAFSSVIALTVGVFALITYNLTYDIAINQQAELLKRLTTEEAGRLASLMPAENTRMAWHGVIGYADGNSYVDVITDASGVVASSVPLNELDERFGISSTRVAVLGRSQEQYGHFVDDGSLYLWARARIPGSSLNLYNIHFNVDAISSSLSTLTTRLMVWSGVLIWIASWVVLIVASVISRNLQRKNEEIEFKSVHDELTELGNRNLLHNELTRMIASDKLQKRRLALLIADIDRFKEINNTLGHRTGDFILKESADRLLRALRSSDIVTRFSADEFAVIAMVDDAVGTEGVAGKINAAFTEPFMIDGQEIKIDVSIGAALYPKHGIDAPTIIRHAEVAMYNAKKSSELLSFYNRSKDRHSKRKLELLNQFTTALANGEMQLHFQPKFTLASKEFDSVEALLRWYHPTKGVLYPSEVLPLAEQMGMMAQMTHWVMDSALRFVAAQKRLGRDINVAINLSASDLEDEQLADKLIALSVQHGVKPTHLTLEITESAIIKAPKSTLELLEKLRDAGVTISIDDFGAGYTSLNFLNRLPISEVKIDSSFIINMDFGDNESTVKSIIELSHSMSCCVVAKGVETAKPLAALRKFGCDVLQGYYLSHPMEQGDFDGWVGESSNKMLKLALA